MTLVMDLGSFACRFGSDTIGPYSIPLLPRQEGSQRELLGAQPAAPFIGGLALNTEAFEKVLGLAQLACSPAGSEDWANYAGQLNMQYEALLQPQQQLTPVPENLLQTFDQLSEVSNTSVHNILMTAPHQIAYKKRICEILFEKYNIENVLFMEQGFASLLSTGSTTGVVVNAGHSALQIACYYQAFWNNALATQENTTQSGYNVDLQIQRVLRQNQIENVDPYNLTQIKVNASKGQDSILPDGQIVRDAIAPTNRLSDIIVNTYNLPQYQKLSEKPVAEQLAYLLSTQTTNTSLLRENIIITGGAAQCLQIPGARSHGRPDAAALAGLQVAAAIATPDQFLSRRLLAEQGDAALGQQ